MDEFLVTIRLRVTVTRPAQVLEAWRGRDPSTSDLLADEPELALSLAVQQAVPPPDLSAVPGLALHRDGTVASVKAERWQDAIDPW